MTIGKFKIANYHRNFGVLMKIFVCLKQVPDTETKIKLTADNTGIDNAGVKWIISPYDTYAIEEGIKLRDANAGSTLTAISVGPARIKERTCITLKQTQL